MEGAESPTAMLDIEKFVWTTFKKLLEEYTPLHPQPRDKWKRANTKGNKNNDPLKSAIIYQILKANW